MWNDHRSTVLSKLFVLLLMAALLTAIISAPWLVRWHVSFRPYLMGSDKLFLTTIYLGALPAASLLYSLYRLLQHILKQEVFVQQNVEHLRRISWSCFLGAAISFISLYYYFPWVLVAVPAAFMGLVVRVVKNMVAQAVLLQDEVDHTI